MSKKNEEGIHFEALVSYFILTLIEFKELFCPSGQMLNSLLYFKVFHVNFEQANYSDIVKPISKGIACKNKNIY